MLIIYIAVYDAYINGYAIENTHCLTDAYMWLYSEFIARQLVMSSISY